MLRPLTAGPGDIWGDEDPMLADVDEHDDSLDRAEAWETYMNTLDAAGIEHAWGR